MSTGHRIRYSSCTGEGLGMQVLRPALALVVGLALASCGAGDPNGTLPGATVASGAAPAAKKHRIKATIRIVIPRKHRHKRLLHGHYLSPATESIAIAVTPAGGGSTQNFNADLTPATNPNCTASLASSLTCTISISLPPGNYTGTFATYDGLLNGGNPTGNELSANQDVPFTIADGQSNVVNVTLDGIPTSVTLLPLGSALSGNATSGYTVSKCFTSAQVEVLGLDADNNPIVGPGAPTPGLASNDTTHLAVATPAPSSPNAYTLSRPNIPNANSVVQLSASVTPDADSGGSAQSVHVNVTFNTDICGVFTEFPIPTAGSKPYSIATGEDGALWFPESNGNKIGRITTGGTITEYSANLTSGSGPFGITAGSDGALWFTECVGNNIGRITTGGTITETSVPTSFSTPYGIAAGSDGALWFAEAVGNKIGRITTDSTPSKNEYTVPTSGSFPVAITTGPDDALWFAEAVGNKIGRITTVGTITEFSVPTSGANPDDIAAGPDVALWFTEYVANKIGRLTLGGTFTEYTTGLTSDAGPYGITAGSDGALWFTEALANKIGRITTGGTVTEYPIPTGSSGPYGITAGPDGALWFVEGGGNKIGRLQ